MKALLKKLGVIAATSVLVVLAVAFIAYFFYLLDAYDPLLLRLLACFGALAGTLHLLGLLHRG